MARVPAMTARTMVPLTEAEGRVLAEDLIAPIDLPRFDNSAMDGYAVRVQGSEAGTANEASARRPRRRRAMGSRTCRRAQRGAHLHRRESAGGLRYDRHARGLHA